MNTIFSFLVIALGAAKPHAVPDVRAVLVTHRLLVTHVPPWVALRLVRDRPAAGPVPAAVSVLTASRLSRRPC